MRAIVLAAGLVLGLGGSALAYDGRDWSRATGHVEAGAWVRPGDLAQKLAGAVKPDGDVGATDHEDDEAVTGSLNAPGFDDETPGGIASKPSGFRDGDPDVEPYADASGKPAGEEAYAWSDTPEELSTGSIERSQDATDKPTGARAPADEDEDWQDVRSETSKPAGKPLD